MSELVTSSLEQNSLERSFMLPIEGAKYFFGKQSDSISFWLIADNTATQQLWVKSVAQLHVLICRLVNTIQSRNQLICIQEEKSTFCY